MRVVLRGVLRNRERDLRCARDSRSTLLNTTRTCNTSVAVYLSTSENLMDLDRGTLASLDRRLLAGLDRDERFQMVRVPVAPAKWSTWKRCCASAGISMGRAVAHFDRLRASPGRRARSAAIPRY